MTYRLYTAFLLCKEDVFKMKVPRFVLDLVAAVVVGALGYWLKADGAIAFLVGIFALLAIEIARLIPLVEKMYHQSEAVTFLLTDLRAPDKFSEVLLLYGLRDLSNLSKSMVSVGRDEARQFWRDCIARTNIKWSALTYAPSDETWGLNQWTAEALAIQQERLVSGCTIERVFIVENENEKNELLEIMECHSRAGIHVFWLLKSDLLEHKTAEGYYTTIGTLDFAVVDDDWVYRTIFDKGQRRIAGANATKDRDICEKAKWLIGEARAIAKLKKGVVQVAI